MLMHQCWTIMNYGTVRTLRKLQKPCKFWIKELTHKPVDLLNRMPGHWTVLHKSLALYDGHVWQRLHDRIATYLNRPLILYLRIVIVCQNERMAVIKRDWSLIEENQITAIWFTLRIAFDVSRKKEFTYRLYTCKRRHLRPSVRLYSHSLSWWSPLKRENTELLAGLIKWSTHVKRS